MRSTEARRSARSTEGRVAVRQDKNVCPWLQVDEQGRGLHIEQFLTFHLIRLANAAKNNVTRRYLVDFGLSVPEWRLLAMTIRFGPVRFSELVSRCSMDKGQVSRTLQMMTRRGFISAKAAPGGRASDGIAQPVIVSVTAKGRKLYQTVLPVAQRHQAALLNALTPQERKALYSIMVKLFSAIGDLDKDVDA
jgi:DNA-binding MarR family transcriptional regulator